MRIYTRRGDDGTTGLLYGGRLGKDDLRVEAYGTSDEAVAALGVARATAAGELAETILRLQRELFVVGAELATAPENRRKLTAGESLVTEAMVDALEALIDTTEEGVEMPSGFVLPGETRCSAALEVARAVVRRAERRAVALAEAGGLPDSQVVRYLNRLADLLWMLARAEEGGSRAVRG